MLSDQFSLVQAGTALLVAVLCALIWRRYGKRTAGVWAVGWGLIAIGTLAAHGAAMAAGAASAPILVVATAALSLAVLYPGLGLVLVGAYEAAMGQVVRHRIVAVASLVLALLGASFGTLAGIEFEDTGNLGQDIVGPVLLSIGFVLSGLFIMQRPADGRPLGERVAAVAYLVYGLVLFAVAMAVSLMGQAHPLGDMVAVLHDLETVLLITVAVAGLLWLMEGGSTSSSASQDTASLYDPLTGLPNRKLLLQRAEQLVEQSARGHRSLAMMVVGLDRFKPINESLGHSAADELLKAVASRLQQSTRSDDVVARIGGDEFAMIFPEVSPQIGGITLSEKMLDIMRQPFFVAGQELLLTASLGGSFYPYNADEADLLLQQAVTALNKAKARGRNTYRLYSPEMDSDTTTQLKFELDLRRAVEREQLGLYYQPLIDVKTGKVCMVEALLRWPHPVKGLLAPDSFLALAQNLGLGHTIDEWVLETACGQIHEWRADHGVDLGLAVNLSADPFQRQGLATFIANVLDRTALDPHALELEITEHTAMLDVEAGLRTLHTLKELGVRLAIDDFGTGYSSFTNLRRFPVDKIKIDKSFVRDLMVDQGDTAIVAALVSLAHSLDLGVVAEGVETAEQAEFLTELGCDQFQGYYFHRPLSPADLLELVRRPGAVRRTTSAA